MKSHFDKSTKFKILGISLCGILVVASVLVAANQTVFAEYEYNWKSTIADKVPDIKVGEDNYKYNNRIQNIAFLGVDTKKTGTENRFYQSGGQVDTIFILSINSSIKEINIIQVNRDSMTNVTTFGPMGDETGSQYTQIALSYAQGNGGKESATNTMKSLSSLLYNIAIDDYYSFGYGAISVATQNLEGVTLTLDDDYIDINESYTKGSTITLIGEDAENFVRYRMDVDDGTNISRMKRQRLFINAFIKQFANQIFTNESFATSLYSSLDEYMGTSMSLSETIKLAHGIRNYKINEIYNLKGVADYSSTYVTYEVDKQDTLNLVLDYCFKKEEN